MIIGKVVSNIISTRKHEGMYGCKLLVIQKIYSETDTLFVAADEIGAGIGDFVLVTQGETSKYAFNRSIPIDSVVVGIVDEEPMLNK